MAKRKKRSINSKAIVVVFALIVAAAVLYSLGTRDVPCGDDICSFGEKSCCRDCGCGDGEICNRLVMECQDAMVADDDALNSAISEHMKENFISGRVVRIVDAYYGEDAAKMVTINCAAEGAEFPCIVILYVSSDYEILEEYRST